MSLWDRLFGQRDAHQAGGRRFEVIPVEHCTQRVGVVGESHYQDAINAVCGVPVEQPVRFGCIAVLSPEPGNPYDPAAIKVEIEGRHVGYLKRSDAAAYGQVVRAGAALGWFVACPAEIGGYGAEGETLNRGVVLQLPEAGTFSVEPVRG